MLQREDLPAIAQRTLRQQPDLREAVDDNAFGLQPVRLPRMIRSPVSPSSRSEEYSEALMLIRIEHAFRRDQFENLDRSRRNDPIHASAPLSRSSFSVSARTDIHADFAGACAPGNKKLQSDGGLSRSRDCPPTDAGDCGPIRRPNMSSRPATRVEARGKNFDMASICLGLHEFGLFRSERDNWLPRMTLV